MNYFSAKSYIDSQKISGLVELIEELVKQDLRQYMFDLGYEEKLPGIINGTFVDWKSITVYDSTEGNPVDKNFAILASKVIDYVKDMDGVVRLVINFLGSFSNMPLHIDNLDLPEYDNSSWYYNMLIPITNHGQSVIDGKVIPNKKGEGLVFDGQVPHAAINQTSDMRITIFLLVDKLKFNNEKL